MAIKTFATGEVLTASDTNTFLANSGLVYVTQTSFTTASFVQINNCFTSTYDNYRIVVNLYSDSTSGRYCHAQLSVSGTPTTTGYYSKSLWYDLTSASAAMVDYDIQTTKLCLGPIGYANTGEGSYSMDLFYPQATKNTKMSANGTGLMAGSYYVSTVSGGLQTGTTSFDGIRILPTANNITGVVAVYGYRKA